MTRGPIRVAKKRLKSARRNRPNAHYSVDTTEATEGHVEKQPFADALDRARHLAGAGRFANLSDGALIERCADEAAFTALVERRGAMVHGVCARILCDQHDAEDACQATFLVLARKASSVRKHASVASWLHGVARRVSLTLLRQRAERRRREQQTPATELPRAGATDLLWSEVQALLDEELERLPERLRAPLVLCYLEGKTRDEASAALGLTPGRLHGLLQRGRELLRDRLAKRGVAFGAGFLATGLSDGVCSALPPTLAVRIAGAAAAMLSGRPLPPTLAGARAVTLTNEVLRAMSHARIKSAVLWGTIAGTLIAGAGITLGFARSEPTPPDAPVRLAAPVPKVPAKPALGVRQSSLPVKWHIESVAISPDGKSIASGHWGGVTIWDAASGAERFTFQSHDAGCTGDVAYRPDGTSLAVTCRGSPVAHKDLNTVYVWDLSKGKDGLADGKPQLRLKGHTDTVLKVVYSPDGKVLATRGRSKHTKLWNATTGKELFNLATGFGQGAAFRPDGKVLATANEDDGGTLWEVATGQEIAKLASAVLPQSDIAFGPDGRTLVLVADDGSVRLW